MSEWLWRGYARCLRRIASGIYRQCTIAGIGPAKVDSETTQEHRPHGPGSSGFARASRDRDAPQHRRTLVESWVHKSTRMAVCLSSFRVCRRRIDGGYCRLMRVTLDENGQTEFTDEKQLVCRPLCTRANAGPGAEVSRPMRQTIGAGGLHRP